jgi:DNA-binding transcriptional regulator GbsR (MarR family)
MTPVSASSAEAAAIRSRLVASGGRLAQSFGFNRVAGEVLACLYLTPGEASLDALEAELQLSKAAVSLAAAQLERLGLVGRVRKAGDRKRYYRSADHLGTALRHGFLKVARARMGELEAELQEAGGALAGLKKDAQTKFLAARVARVREVNRRAGRLLANPVLQLLSNLG